MWQNLKATIKNALKLTELTGSGMSAPLDWTLMSKIFEK
jgi:hypothetical protein